MQGLVTYQLSDVNKREYDFWQALRDATLKPVNTVFSDSEKTLRGKTCTL